MVKAKSVKKKTTKKIVRKSSKKTKPRYSSKTTFENVENFEKPFKQVIRVRAIKPTTNRKINVVLGNFLFFIVLFILSNVIYVASTQAFYKDLFFMISLISGSLSLAFLIALLALIFLRVFRKH